MDLTKYAIGFRIQGSERQHRGLYPQLLSYKATEVMLPQRGLRLVVLGLLALQSAYAATNAADVAALAGLQRCIAQHASKLPYVMGWNISSSSSSSTPGINSAPGAAAVTAQLAALGVPGLGSPPPAAAASAASGSSDPCGTVPWTGLLCTGDRVTSVLISQIATIRNLPCDVATLADLANLGEVTTVDFTNAGLTGSLPAAWAYGFGSLTSLTLAQNDIEGELPAAWRDGFKNLVTLDLNQNRIGGQLPPAWGSGAAFPALINLVLGNNDISGELPEWTGGFPRVQLFGLSSNQLGGVLPDIWNFPSLRTLELYSNDLYGCLPGSWPINLPNLTSLTLQNNLLSGELPETYDDWDSLTSIAITPGNEFCGTISAEFAATPDSRGRRFNPEPQVADSAGGYDLPSCNGVACPGYAYAAGPAPAAAPAVAAASAAAAAPQLPAVAVAGRRRLLHK